MDRLFIEKCSRLIEAFRSGKLGQTKMPEDTSPMFLPSEQERRLSYFSLPMALNYQRDSYKLWESALKTYLDPATKEVFDISVVAKMDKDALRESLLKYRLALQPNKHIETWQTLAKTIAYNFGSFQNLILTSNTDYLQLKEIVQQTYKKGFPYLSGPKIFNYWAFILCEYGHVPLASREYIEIAPDTHITQGSVRLGVITLDEAKSLSKERISERWRLALKGSGINPIDMHPPLWFWSRNGFIFQL